MTEQHSFASAIVKARCFTVRTKKHGFRGVYSLLIDLDELLRYHSKLTGFATAGIFLFQRS